MRQAKLAELLAADGHEVSTFAIDKLRFEGDVRREELARTATQGADCVILPLPLQSREGMLSAPLSSGLHTIHEILSVLSPGQTICAGRVDGASRKLAETMELTLIDYLQREELAVANAVAAAEGAIGLIMQETPITVAGSECLILGFGRIGKLLSHRMKGLGAHVTATARSVSDLAWIRAYGYGAEETGKLDGKLSRFDVVVNTIPGRVIGESHLRELKKDCLCLDLASKPGGGELRLAKARQTAKL
jgi:dipicolinate synthase subunit A